MTANGLFGLFCNPNFLQIVLCSWCFQAGSLFLYCPVSLQNYFLGYGYCVYAGMMLFVLLAYALRNKKQGFDFWQSLMCAFVMFGMGVLTLFLSLILLISVIIEIFLRNF